MFTKIQISDGSHVWMDQFFSLVAASVTKLTPLQPTRLTTNIVVTGYSRETLSTCSSIYGRPNRQILLTYCTFEILSTRSALSVYSKRGCRLLYIFYSSPSGLCNATEKANTICSTVECWVKYLVECWVSLLLPVEKLVVVKVGSWMWLSTSSSSVLSALEHSAVVQCSVKSRDSMALYVFSRPACLTSIFSYILPI